MNKAIHSAKRSTEQIRFKPLCFTSFSAVVFQEEKLWGKFAQKQLWLSVIYDAFNGC